MSWHHLSLKQLSSDQILTFFQMLNIDFIETTTDNRSIWNILTYHRIHENRVVNICSVFFSSSLDQFFVISF